MPSSSFPRKGRALLLSTAAAGLALSAAMAAPPALATDECGTPSGNAVTCTSAGNPYAGGITYTSAGAPLTLTTNADVNVQGTGPISVTTSGADANIINNGTVSTSTNANGGVDAESSGGNVSITNAGNVTTTGTNTAALFGLANAGTVTIDNSATLQSAANGITASSLTGSTITNEGTITPGSGAFAIAVTSGTAQITNSGTMNGPISLAGSGNTVTNSGTWNVTDTSSFGANGSANTFNNTGTLAVAPGVTPSTSTAVTFSNLSEFNNSGAVDMRGGSDLNIAPAQFNGNTGSQLLVLANGQNGVLNVGSSSGLTSVEPTDVLGAAPGKLNLGGSLLVTGANEGTFDLAGNPNNVFHKGFVDYVLQFNQNQNSQTGTYTLFGLPGREVFEALSIPRAAQNYWENSANAWTQRAMSIRDSLVGQAARPEGWEVWLAPYGGHSKFDRQQVFSFGGFDFDSIGTHTSFFGLQAGADLVSKMANGYGYWGFTGGMEQQETSFIGDNENNLYLIGGNLGMYGGINWGGLYFNALGKVDFINMNANFNSAGFSPTQGWMTWGGKGEVGYRFPFAGFFVEPAGRVSAIWTNDNDLFPAGGVLHFSNDNPIVLGQAGGRVGYTMSNVPFASFLFGQSFHVYGGAFWADQWNGKNRLTFVTGPDLANDSVSLAQRSQGSFIRAEYGIETDQMYGGLKAYFKGHNDFNGDGVGGWDAEMGFHFNF